MFHSAFAGCCRNREQVLHHLQLGEIVRLISLIGAIHKHQYRCAGHQCFGEKLGHFHMQQLLCNLDHPMPLNTDVDANQYKCQIGDSHMGNFEPVLIHKLKVRQHHSGNDQSAKNDE
ncbi:hypothetical protein D3C73_1377070 [compost metagenome]